MVGSVHLPHRPPRRRVSFSLTPLADVMFQLLIFFMLSTSLAPYALIPLGVGAPEEAAPEGTAGVPLPRVPGTPAPEIWQLGPGSVRIAGTRLSFDALPQEARRAQQSGAPEVVLFVATAASVQDLATVLEALRTARVPKVRLVGRGIR